MARFASTGFRLFSAPLPQAAAPGSAQSSISQVLTQAGVPVPPAGFAKVATALRWITDPVFGFPRQPFNVYRRPRKYSPVPLVPGRVVIDGEQVFSTPLGDLYLVLAKVALTAGQQLVFEPLDSQQQAMPGKAVTFNTSTATATVCCPHMTAVRIKGQGVVADLGGVVQNQLLNEPDWTLLQRVGLPLPKGAVPDAAYRTFPQGWGTAPVLAGDAFAKFRLALGQALHLPPPPLPTGAQPTWLAPDPAAFLTYLQKADDSLLRLIAKCLSNTDDTSPDATKRQPGYRAKLTITTGLHQAGTTDTGKPGTAEVPVVGTALLAASSDNFAALALGYGTYDFPPAASPSPTALMTLPQVFDYMVTAVYVVRPLESVINISAAVEFAALSEELPLPQVPTGLSVKGLTQNRPLQRDQPTTEAVQLQFYLPPAPLAYGLMRSSAADKVLVLNSRRVYSPNSYTPFLPKLSDPNNQSYQCRLTDPVSPVPLAGTDARTYFLAGLDVFGRWSGYAQQAYTARAIVPQRPGLLALKLYPNGEPAAGPSPASVPCTLEVEFSWDWTERSPQVIELGGGFYPADSTAPPAVTTGFALQPGNPEAPTAKITFDAQGQPAASVGQVYVVTSPDSDLRHYRLVVPIMQPVFPGPLLVPVAGLSKVAYGVVARALEKVRAASGEYCPWSAAPLTVSLADPRPPATPTLPPDLRWTALPDATRVARGKLTWPSVPGAAGYVVWQATETALREQLGLPVGGLTTYADRAAQLRDQLLKPAPLTPVGQPAQPTPEVRSQRAFARLNLDPLPAEATSVEVDLPGAASTLFAYRVSAVSGANMESARSAVVFVAVPRLVVPGAPQLQLTVVKNPDGSAAIDVLAQPGPGPVPAGFRAYRVRKILPTNEVELKGLPVLTDKDVGWQVPKDPQGNQLPGQVVRQVITEHSWKPYYYQVVAIGPDKPTEGLLPGESVGSPTLVAYVVPDTPPTLTVLSDTRNAQVRLLECATSVPFGPLKKGTRVRYLDGGTVKTGRLGEPQAEVLRYDQAPASSLRRRVAALALPIGKVPVLAVPPTLTAPPFDAAKGVEVSRVAATGRLYLRLPLTLASGFVRVTDPLGRTVEIEFK